MAQGYFYSDKKEDVATFDYFYRSNPFNGGFTVFAGLSDFLELLEDFKYSSADIEYLEGLGFRPEFLTFLSEFNFSGNIRSVKEGEIVFPNEPILTVEGNIIECQLIESLLLNILNFETMIATKAFRIKMVAGDRAFSDFGLRRAQGFGAIHASRAAIIGGATSTSNVLAGKMFNIPVSGTMAHSWVQSFDNELEAFRAYSLAHPKNTVLLVDTYDTLKSGVPHAIAIAKEMETKGQRLQAIRLDSGDLAYLSKKVRRMLKNAGLDYVKIIASNQLDEFVIKSLLKDQNAAIDAFGVGTSLVTGNPDAALDGVYKLSQANATPKMKLSENIVKTTLPGKKQLVRYFDNNGKFYRDAILLDSEIPSNTDTVYHPVYANKYSVVKNLKYEILLNEVVRNGKRLPQEKSAKIIHNYVLNRAQLLPLEHKRFISPHIYKVGISNKLMLTRNALANELKTLD